MSAKLTDRMEEVLEQVDKALYEINECNYMPELEGNKETKNLILIASIAMNTLWHKIKG